MEVWAYQSYNRAFGTSEAVGTGNLAEISIAKETFVQIWQNYLILEGLFNTIYSYTLYTVFSWNCDTSSQCWKNDESKIAIAIYRNILIAAIKFIETLINPSALNR